jgi:hypothetical protein
MSHPETLTTDPSTQEGSDSEDDVVLTETPPDVTDPDESHVIRGYD